MATAQTRPKVCFVNAPADFYDQNYGTRFIPLWAYTLAAYVTDHWDIEIVDCKIEDPDLTGPADIFVFSGINQDIDSIRGVHDRLKEKYPGATFVLGGPVTWSLEKEGKLDFLAYFDHLFVLDGERTLPEFLAAFERGAHKDLPQIIHAERFPVEHARKIRFDLLYPKAHFYYGAVIEVSRGCPFLCEFCDIRVLPGNNRSNNKQIDLIIAELDEYHKLGITQIQFACDNFIGNVDWARNCVKAINAWKLRTGATISIFTWLTINLYKMPRLLEDMRRAGFSILFIGIESVNRNSLLETAKVQNIGAMHEAIREIQAYGFIIAPGLIFGFDSDNKMVFDETLQFFIETGLIGGDPSFLMALAGTPLYERMQASGRLLERDDAVAARKKIQTNIRYLQNSDFLMKGFLRFIESYTSPDFQYARFKIHLQRILDSGKFIPVEGGGYASLWAYLKLQLEDPYKTSFFATGSRSARYNRKMLLSRILYLLRKPSVFAALIKGWWLLRRSQRRYPSLGINFNYWVYVWTNIGLKYWGITERDFSLHSVGDDFDLTTLMGSSPQPTAEPVLKSDARNAVQLRYTNRALKILIDKKAEQDGSHPRA